MNRYAYKNKIGAPNIPPGLLRFARNDENNRHCEPAPARGGGRSNPEKPRRILAAILFILLAMPSGAHASLQNTSSSFENLLNVLTANADQIPQSAILQSDVGAAQTLTTVADLQKLDLPGLSSSIEAFKTASQLYEKSGGSPQGLINTLQTIDAKLAPIVNLADSSDGLKNFGSTLGNILANAPALPTEAGIAISQAAKGVQDLAGAVTSLKTITSGGTILQKLQAAKAVLESQAVGQIGTFFASSGSAPSSGVASVVSSARDALSGSLPKLTGGSSLVSSAFDKIAKSGGSAAGALTGAFFGGGGSGTVGQSGAAAPTCSSLTLQGAKNFLEAQANVGLFTGVPVVEKGSLLQTTNKIAAFEAQICNYLQDLHSKEYKIDPAERQKALTETLSTARAVIETAKTSYEGPDGVQNASLVPENIGEIKRNAEQEEVKKVIHEIRESGLDNTTKQALIKRISADYLVRKDPDADLRRALDPSKNSFNSPGGTPLGRYLAIKEELDTRIDATHQEIDNELVRNNGFLDVKTCVEKLPDGTCKNAAWRTVSPGSLVARGVQEASLVPLRAAEASREIGDFENGITPVALRNQPEQVRQFAAAPAGQALRNTPTVSRTTGGAATQSGTSLSTIFNNLSKIANAACTISPNLSICRGRGQGAGGTTVGTVTLPTVEAGAPVTIAPPPPAQPSLVASSTTATLDGRTLSLVAWQAREVTSCTTGNNWISYGRGGAPTLAAEVLTPLGQSVSASGVVEIYHPALFRAESSAYEGATNQNTLPPPSQARAISNRITIATTSTPFPSSTVSQTTTFAPNMANLEDDDIVAFGVNGQFIGAFGTSTPRGLSDTIRKGLVSPDISPERKAEYGNYQVGGTDAVTLTRGVEVSGFIRDAVLYTVSCTGVGGEQLEQTVSLRFSS